MKHIFRLMVAMLAVWTLSSCSDSDDSDVATGDGRWYVDIYVEDAAGSDLLDPASESCIIDAGRLYHDAQGTNYCTEVEMTNPYVVWRPPGNVRVTVLVDIVERDGRHALRLWSSAADGMRHGQAYQTVRLVWSDGYEADEVCLAFNISRTSGGADSVTAMADGLDIASAPYDRTGTVWTYTIRK